MYEVNKLYMLQLKPNWYPGFQRTFLKNFCVPFVIVRGVTWGHIRGLKYQMKMLANKPALYEGKQTLVVQW